MLKKEWSNFCKNWWLKVVVVAIIAIPSIYAGVFLGSIWDPYGNTKEIPVAVVNEDKKVEYNDSTLDVGKELAKSLQENDAMSFNLVDEKTASEGLKDGNYYMVITIPQDFSKNATTLLDAQPQKMVLNYTTNPGSSYIASKMDDSAIAKIKAEVSATVTKTYAETIFNQLGTVGSGMSEAADGSSQINDGANQLIDGNKTISDNLEVLASSSITFKDGASTLTNGLRDYTDGVVTVNNGVYSLKDGISTLNNATPALSSGINQLDNGAEELQAGVSKYTAGVNLAYQGSSQLVSNNTTLSTGVDELAAGAKQLKAGNQQISVGLQQLSENIKTSKVTLDSYFQLISTVEQSNPNLAASIKQNGLTVDQAALMNIKLENDIPPAYDLLKIISNGTNEINTAINGGTLANGQKTDGLLKGSNTVQAGLNNLSASISGGNYINSDGSKTTIPAEKSLTTGLKTYLAGTEQINSGLAQLNENSKSLNDGATKLKAGTSQLASQTPVLTNGIGALNQGANQLANGTTTLVSNNATLLNGANQLANGALQISDGANKLAAGSNTLGAGLTTLQDGANTLATSLQDGADQVNSINSNDNTIDMLASPVDTAHQEISTVKNNGHGMAPYMMSVGLYVACMAFTLMYPLFNDVEKAESGFKYWLSKASIWFAVSTIAATLMIASLMVFCDFAPQQLLMTFIFAIIVGAASMALVTLLSIICGKIGEFVLLVFMVINLGGSAGTYPLETSSALFKAIHPFMPFTYSVDGFRKVISMTNVSLNTEILVFVGVIVVCSLLTILAYNHRIKKPTPLIPQAFENVNE